MSSIVFIKFDVLCLRGVYGAFLIAACYKLPAIPTVLLSTALEQVIELKIHGALKKMQNDVI